MACPAAPHDPAFQQSLRRLAERAARAGGAVALAAFGSRLDVRRKLDGSEVTDVDELAERTILECIRAVRPDDDAIGEEMVERRHVAATGATVAPAGVPPATGLSWIIDPLDGTRNFTRGIPHYACTVAVLSGGTPLAGAIFDPPQNRMYSASRAEGAFVDDRPLLGPAAARIADQHRTPLVAIPSTRHGRAHALVYRLVDQMVVRNFGSTALHLAMVASGQLDVMLATNAKLWDIAAGWLLINGAGGVVSSPEGAPLFPLDLTAYDGTEIPTLAACDALHAAMIMALHS